MRERPDPPDLSICVAENHVDQAVPHCPPFRRQQRSLPRQRRVMLKFLDRRLIPRRKLFPGGRRASSRPRYVLFLGLSAKAMISGEHDRLRPRPYSKFVENGRRVIANGFFANRKTLSDVEVA